MLLYPQRFTVGETMEWTLSPSDYPADEWTLTLNAGASAGAFSATAEASGTSHALTITAAISAAFAVSTYRYQLVVSKGSGEALCRRIIEAGYLVVDAAVSGSTAADTRSTWKKILDALEAAYRDYVATGALRTSYSIGDSSRSFATHEEIITAIDRARYEVKKEDREERGRFGQPRGGRVLTRF